MSMRAGSVPVGVGRSESSNPLGRRECLYVCKGGASGGRQSGRLRGPSKCDCARQIRAKAKSAVGLFFGWQRQPRTRQWLLWPFAVLVVRASARGAVLLGGVSVLLGKGAIQHAAHAVQFIGRRNFTCRRGEIQCCLCGWAFCPGEA